jgi:hypothetical protein
VGSVLNFGANSILILYLHSLGGPSRTLVGSLLPHPVTPTAIALQNEFASYEAHYEIEGNTLTASRNLNIYKDELPSSLANDYGAFREQVLTDSALVMNLSDSEHEPSEE